MSHPLHLNVWIQNDEGYQNILPVVLGEAVIGRLQGCEIRLDERNISRRHARLFLDPSGAVFAEDLESYNGLYVNNQKVVGLVEVFEGDVLTVGDFRLVMHGVGLRARHESQDTERTDPHILMPFPQETTDPGVHKPKSLEMGFEDTAVVRVSGHKAAAAAESYLLCLTPEWSGEKVVLKEGDTTIGRSSVNTVAVNHRSLSRVHAKISCVEGLCTLVDMGSANGTLVNGEEYARTTLRHGDVIECGHVKWGFVSAGALDVPAWGLATDAGQAQGIRWSLPVVVAVSVVVVVCGVLGAWALRSKLVASKKPSVPSLVETLPEVPLAPVVDAAALYQKAEAAMAQRQWDLAARYAKQVLQEQPAHSKARALAVLAEREAQAFVSYEAVKAAVASKQWAEAWNAVQEIFPESVYASEARVWVPEIRRGLIQERALAVRKAVDAQRWDDAESFVEEIAGLDPAYPELPALKSILARARRAKPSDAAVAVPKKEASLGLEYARTNLQPSVMPQPEAPTKKSDDTKKVYTQGVSLLQAGELQQAANLFLQCVGLDKEYALCYRALGITYARLGDALKAAKYYRLYITIAPQAKDAAEVKHLLEQYDGHP